MSDRKITTSKEEMENLLKEGYVVTSIAHFSEGDIPTYTLEKDTEWSKNFDKK